MTCLQIIIIKLLVIINKKEQVREMEGGRERGREREREIKRLPDIVNITYEGSKVAPGDSNVIFADSAPSAIPSSRIVTFKIKMVSLASKNNSEGIK